MECFCAGTPSAVCLFFRSPAIESKTPPNRVLPYYYYTRLLRKSKRILRNFQYFPRKAPVKKYFSKILDIGAKKELTFAFSFVIINAFVGHSSKLAFQIRGVAQLVARMVRDHEVVGSNPVASTKTAVSPLVVRLFLILRFATGFEGGSRFAGAKRFALRNLDYRKLDGKGRR